MTIPRENVQKLLTDVAGSVTGDVVAAFTGDVKTIVGTVVGTGSVAATITIQISADEVNWVQAAVITLSGTTSSSDAVALANAAPYWRAVSSGVSGTGALVNCSLCGN